MMNEDELKAWDKYAAAALVEMAKQYSSRPEAAARSAAQFADAMTLERREREHNDVG